MTKINRPKTSPQNNNALTIDQPARYCIRVVGNLDDNWSDRLAGLTISSSSRIGTKGVSTLTGTVIDQAALFGVLKALYDMRMPLLNVECLETSDRRNL